MEITGKVWCFFEQSGTFKNEFKKLGYEAVDVDIQNNFGETDFQIDLFKEIEEAYEGKPSIFDQIGGGDLILAFFPCIYFCDAKTMMFKGISNFYSKRDMADIMDNNIKIAVERERYFLLLMKLVSVCSRRKLRIIIENPWNSSGATYLQHNFVKPTIVDRNRSLRGDDYVKPTAYWYFNCINTQGYSIQKNKNVKAVYNQRDKHPVKQGCCSPVRSAINPNYARNFICDFILGKEQELSQKTLFG